MSSHLSSLTSLLFTFSLSSCFLSSLSLSFLPFYLLSFPCISIIKLLNHRVSLLIKAHCTDSHLCGNLSPSTLSLTPSPCSSPVQWGQWVRCPPGAKWKASGSPPTSACPEHRRNYGQTWAILPPSSFLTPPFSSHTLVHSSPFGGNVQYREWPYHISHVGLEFKFHRGAKNIVVHLHEPLLVTGGI